MDLHPEIQADRKFVEEAALLHDIGVYKTYAPEIACSGSYLIFVTVTWEPISSERRVTGGMLWFVNGTRVQVSAFETS